MRPKLSAVAVAALVLLAGCTGAPGVGPGADGDTTTLADSDVNSGENAEETGTVRFYISDERNAIGDFEHLNVTVTKVGLHRADESDGENETDDETANATTTNVTTTNTTTEATESTTTTTEMEDGDDAEMEGENETDDAETESEEEENETDDGERSSWVTHDVDNRTIDLTEYQGANATLLDNLTVPNGTYDKVFVYVSGINATLDSGESVNVKLPSSKLHVNKEFTVGNGQSVDFVFDITVFKAGNSGKYILKPVVGQSGTDVPIETPDRGERDDRGDDRNEEAKEGEQSEADEDDRGGQGPPGENRSDGPEAESEERGDLLAVPSL